MHTLQGHIGPSTSEAFIKHQKPIGQGGSGVSEAESVRIVQSEIENLDIIDEVIKREKFDVDFWCGELCEGMFFRLSCLYFQNDSLPTCIVTCSPRVEEIVRRAQRRLSKLASRSSGARGDW